MIDEEEALIGFKKMQQNYNEISQIGNTSVLVPNPLGLSYLPNENLGMTAALDLEPQMIANQMNMTGFTNIFGVNQFNMDPQDMSLG